MEGKAILFMRFADIDAFDLELAATTAAAVALRSDTVCACEASPSPMPGHERDGRDEPRAPSDVKSL